MTTYVKVKMDAALYVLVSENKEQHQVYLVKNGHAGEPVVEFDESEVAFRSEDRAAAEAYQSKNFCITDWVDEFFSFIDDTSKHGGPMPVTEAQRVGFCMADAMGEVAPIQGDFLYAIAKKRAQALGLECTPGFLIFVASMATSPGEVVMILHAMRHTMDADLLTLEDRVNKPKYAASHFWRNVEGKTPSREHMHKMWDAQKGKPGQKVDNWLDMIAQEDRFVQAIRDGYVRMQ